MNFGNPHFGCDEATARSIIDTYLAAGHNFIDTANVYAGGHSESIIGRALKGRRNDVIIATKAGAPIGPSPDDRGGSRKHFGGCSRG